MNYKNAAYLGSSRALAGKVSRTIEDAMTVTKSPGIQYLWVDAICILQDNTPDKVAHLGLNGQVYKQALFTIIAACGSNVEGGSVGVWEPRAVSQQIIENRGQKKP